MVATHNREYFQEENAKIVMNGRELRDNTMKNALQKYARIINIYERMVLALTVQMERSLMSHKGVNVYEPIFWYLVKLSNINKKL